MDRLQNKNAFEQTFCSYENRNNTQRLSDCIVLSNHLDDPLRQPEITINLNNCSITLPDNSLEELEDDIFDYETDVLSQDGSTESEEHVVPSSQLSSSYKYPEEITISDDEIDEGIFEEDLPSYNWQPLDDNNTHNSQPP